MGIHSRTALVDEAVIQIPSAVLSKDELHLGMNRQQASCAHLCDGTDPEGAAQPRNSTHPAPLLQDRSIGIQSAHVIYDEWLSGALCPDARDLISQRRPSKGLELFFGV